MCQNLEVIVGFVWNPEYDGWNSLRSKHSLGGVKVNIV